MHTMLKVRIPVEAGNDAIRDGRIAKVIAETAAAIKPEASYFYSESGQRTALFFFDLKDPTDVCPISERFFLELSAAVEMFPVMSAAELQQGMAKIKMETAVPA